MKLIKLVVITFIFIFIFMFLVGCDRKIETTNYHMYKGSFFVLLPARCIDVMLNTLKQGEFVEGVDYSYEKFLGPGEAYSDVHGFIELIEHEGNSKQKLLNMRSNLVSECYPTGTYGTYRDGMEFDWLAKQVAFLEKNDVEIYAIKIDEEVINIHIYFADFRDKGLSVLDVDN